MGKKLSDLPIGAKVVDPDTKYYGKPIVWLVADKNHVGYPANSVTLISEKILCLKCFDAKEPNNPDIERKTGGNNNYKKSNINKWLNSVGDWYVPQHQYDTPPNSANLFEHKNPYDTEPGFLTNMSVNFREKLLSTTLSIDKEIDGKQDYENMEAKVFLASLLEVGYGDSKGSLAFFAGNNSKTAYPTPETISHSNYKYWGFEVSRPWYWFLRTSFSNDRDKVWVEQSLDNSQDIVSAYVSVYGIRPLCNLSSEILVSDNPDSDGIYRFNHSPTISTNIGNNLGIKSEPFSFSYSVNDEDTGQTITIKEYIDGKQKRSFTAERNKSYFFEITKEEWQELLNANHILKITVEDSNGGKTEKTFTFSKNETKIEFELKTPLKADDRITKALINVSAEIPAGAAITVEACNNAFDEEPAWEDMTTRVKKGSKLFFKNKDKTSEKWGFNVRVKVNRNGATGECYIRSIGGNFE